jgi:hypothetical protein
MILYNKHIISKPIYSVILIMDVKLRESVENNQFLWTFGNWIQHYEECYDIAVKWINE